LDLTDDQTVTTAHAETGRSSGMVLFRRLLGEVLRTQRMRQGRTLRQLSADARVSLGYISEIERGQKEASSELLASLCAALDVPLSEILAEVSDAVALEEAAMAVALEDVALNTTSIETATSDGGSRSGDVVASAA
jgi:transcriptional regulator with XRE-family HTH domain